MRLRIQQQQSADASNRIADIAKDGKVYFSDASQRAPWLRDDGQIATFEAGITDVIVSEALHCTIPLI